MCYDLWMLIQIDDPETEVAVRKLAEAWGVDVEAAIRRAAEAALERQCDAPVLERLRPLLDRVAQMPRSGLTADKDFYDSLNDE